ncbi:ferrous iron transporter B [Wenzhouxiangella limi]|uniref:Ferrous iron transport protein B n=1 Tax=Wenzhouxiangella limi TaxID=2707351 RepID=A0A845UZP4_9GAMM|nr:ferrous iron transporter B [Wenzhouxiangella limi]NDY96847.1 ferrous iron transporter B [Wenzhouxiangella limi]
MSQGPVATLELPRISENRPTAGARRLLFAGNPNAGKTTLFNRLTGLKARTSNHIGTTVEVRKARVIWQGQPVEMVDLPGLYGLDNHSAEERVAAEYIESSLADPAIDLTVVMVADATNLERSLYLAGQLRERCDSLVIALNMTDLTRRRGIELDCQHLAIELGASVVPVSARSGEGLDELRDALVAGAECAANGCPACLACSGCKPAKRYAWAEQVNERAGGKGLVRDSRLTQVLDDWLTHPVYGLAAFILVMGALFQSIFMLAETPMNWIDTGFASLGAAAAGWLPDNLLGSFVVDGVIAGLGGTLIFLPQIFILFLLISVLEDTGYLARAAFVVDRYMARAGLPGRAFVPMLSAHACAIPAIMSTRTIDNPRDRLATMLVLPLFSCSARIPVYIMVTAMLFADQPLLAGAVFAGAYFLGIVAAFAAAVVIRGTLLKGRPNPLLIELPTYKRPHLQTALTTAIDRSGLFLRRAATLILTISVILWALGTFPRLDPEQLPAATAEQVEQLQAEQAAPERIDAVVAAAQLEYSFAGRLGKTIEPVFAPLGFDWQISVGVLASFAAREVIASTLSVLYGMGGDGEEDPDSIGERLRDNVSPAAGLSLLVFFVLAMQCLPTQVITRRETGTWRWPLFQLGYMSVLAYTAAFIVYQVGSIWLG